MITSDKHLQDFGDFLSTISSAAANYPTSVTTLIKYTSTPIESEVEVLERAEVMDRMMDMAKHEDDIVLIFVNAIADRIEAFESNMEMPFVSTSERMRGQIISGLNQEIEDVELGRFEALNDVHTGKRLAKFKERL